MPTYKICSRVGPNSDRYKTTFWIEKKKSFNKWVVLYSGHEKFDGGKVELIKFKDYNDAENYLVAKYSRGYSFVKDSNVYKLYIPQYWV
jgi:hypothetical protein